MTSTRNRSPIINSYHLLCLDIFRADNSVTVLGFKLNNSLNLGIHIELVYCKAFKILGFVNRISNSKK